MKIIGYFFTFFTCLSLAAQDEIVKTFDLRDMELLAIDASKVFSLHLQTHALDVVVVKARIEGEFHNDVFISGVREGSALSVSVAESPAFRKFSDKLNAHKVLSVSMEIFLPQDILCTVEGNYCEVEARGNYERLSIWNNSGSVKLNSTSGQVKAETLSGDIHGNKLKGAAKTLSKFGEVFRGNLPPGGNEFELSSIRGNIYLNYNE